MRNITLPVLTPKKALGGGLLKKEVQKAVAAGTLKSFDEMDRPGQIPEGAETDIGTNGESPRLTPAQQKDADVVAKLSPDFPIQTWDSMSYKAQLQAMKFSGLTEQEQWQLLNPSAPLSVLDAANRERIRPAAPTGTGNSPRIPANPSKTTYLQNEQSEGQLDITKGFPDAATPKKPIGRRDTLKFITEYPAIAQFVDVGRVTPEQLTILSDAQYELAALKVKGHPTQQEIDDILADTCTKMLTDENRPTNDKKVPQETILAHTNVIDQYLRRKRAQGEAAAKSIQASRITGNDYYYSDVFGYYLGAQFDFFVGNFPEGKYDLRHMSSWEAEITDYSPSAPPLAGSRFLFVYDGDLLSVEDLGSAMYGFYGMSLGFSVDDLYKGAGLASRAGNAFDDDPQTIPDRNNGYLGDDAEDRAAVNLGIKWYLEGKGK